MIHMLYYIIVQFAEIFLQKGHNFYFVVHVIDTD